MVTFTASDCKTEGDPKRSRYKLGLSHMEWEMTILIMWDVMLLHYWVSDFQNLKGMLAITYSAMQCHIPEDRNLKMHHSENLRLIWSSNGPIHTLLSSAVILPLPSVGHLCC